MLWHRWAARSSFRWLIARFQISCVEWEKIGENKFFKAIQSFLPKCVRPTPVKCWFLGRAFFWFEEDKLHLISACHHTHKKRPNKKRPIFSRRLFDVETEHGMMRFWNHREEKKRLREMIIFLVCRVSSPILISTQQWHPLETLFLWLKSGFLFSVVWGREIAESIHLKTPPKLKIK